MYTSQCGIACWGRIRHTTWKWNPLQQSRNGRLPRWGSWCDCKALATSFQYYAITLPGTSQLASLLTASISLLRRNPGATSRSCAWTGWMMRHINRLVLRETGREMLWSCSRWLFGEIIGQPTLLGAMHSNHLCSRETKARCQKCAQIRRYSMQYLGCLSPNIRKYSSNLSEGCRNIRDAEFLEVLL